RLCLMVSLSVALPVLLLPSFVLYPLLGKSDMSLISETRPVFHLLLGVLALSTTGSVLTNALAGTGATWFGLKLQALSITVYLTYIFIVTNFTSLGLVWVWVAELVYWATMISMAFLYLRSERWHALRF